MNRFNKILTEALHGDDPFLFVADEYKDEQDAAYAEAYFTGMEYEDHELEQFCYNNYTMDTLPQVPSTAITKTFILHHNLAEPGTDLFDAFMEVLEQRFITIKDMIIDEAYGEE